MWTPEHLQCGYCSVTSGVTRSSKTMPTSAVTLIKPSWNILGPIDSTDSSASPLPPPAPSSSSRAPVAGAERRAACVANCLRGALPPVDMRAVCSVLPPWPKRGASSLITTGGPTVTPVPVVSASALRRAFATASTRASWRRSPRRVVSMDSPSIAAPLPSRACITSLYCAIRSPRTTSLISSETRKNSCFRRFAGASPPPSPSVWPGP
mmetsp:Transcript_891/g.1485  ORF Transcript_891/g.1485 Transcript_891/m.1485 type:complete len:209 (-) Transcript_891:370-996(-)